MKRRFILLLTATVLAVSARATSPTQPHADRPLWEETELSADMPLTPAADIDSPREPVEVFIRDNTAYIHANAAVKVEIFSILGQLIASRKMQPGTVRLNLRQRGVYILKAGGTTRRINI